MAQFCLRCDIAANWVGFTLSQVFHSHLFRWSGSFQILYYFSLKWLHIVLCVSLTFSRSLRVISGVPLPFTQVALCQKRHTAANWGGSVSFHLFACWSPGFLSIVLGIPLPLTRVVLHYALFPTATQWFVYKSFQVSPDAYFSGSVLFHVSLCLSQQGLCVFFRCFTAAFLSTCVLFQVYHCFTLEFICIVLIVLVPLTGVALFHFIHPVPLNKVTLHGLIFPSPSHCGFFLSF